jgi:hypothetical protein
VKGDEQAIACSLRIVSCKLWESEVVAAIVFIVFIADCLVRESCVLPQSFTPLFDIDLGPKEMTISELGNDNFNIVSWISSLKLTGKDKKGVLCD